MGLLIFCVSISVTVINLKCFQFSVWNQKIRAKVWLLCFMVLVFFKFLFVVILSYSRYRGGGAKIGIQ